jgi:TetR/AcrR family transcriptional regulator, acrAB operon repressor
MPRRTKQDALATRELLLDAAAAIFQQHGVSRTSLAQIASAAGVTRGAIYWHFEDKADLFEAMMNRVCLPFEEAFRRGVDAGAPDPLGLLVENFVAVLRKVVSDPQVRQAFEIAIRRVEYVDDMSSLHERHLRIREGFLVHVVAGLQLAVQRRQLGTAMPAREMAIGLHALMDGLIQNWTIDPESFDLVEVGQRVIGAYLAGLAPARLSSSVSRHCSRTP